MFMSIGVWAKVAFSLRYVSSDTRRIDFPHVDGLSTNTPGLGRHKFGLGWGQGNLSSHVTCHFSIGS